VGPVELYVFRRPSNQCFCFIYSFVINLYDRLICFKTDFACPVDLFALQWIENPEHNFIQNYVSFRKANPKSNFHIVHPQYLWRLWDYIQDNTNSRLTRNPPSSGFLGNYSVVYTLEHK